MPCSYWAFIHLLACHSLSLFLFIYIYSIYIYLYLCTHTWEHHQKCTANFCLRQYSDYEVYFQRIRQGHRNVLNPGALPRLAMTSATQGEPKFLPDVTDLGKTFYRRPGRLREHGMWEFSWFIIVKLGRFDFFFVHPAEIWLMKDPCG